MKKINFLELVENMASFNLFFPFHIYFNKLDGNLSFNPSFQESFHEHTFEGVLKIAYLEPFAFYLTEEDKEYYSKQEIKFIELLQENMKNELKERKNENW